MLTCHLPLANLHPCIPFSTFVNQTYMKTRALFTVLVFSLLLTAALAACRASAPASPTPSPTVAPTRSPEQALLDERDLAAHELGSAMEKARLRGASEEELAQITRAYVATIEAIEQELTARGATFQPLNLPPTPTPALQKRVFDIGMVTQDGVHIQGTYYQPAAVHAPGVLLLHMLGRQRQDWDPFARTLQEAGYGVLTIDFRGHGASEGTREWDKMPLDAAIAVKYLRGRPEIDPARIVIIGASIGANVAINYAATDPQVRGVALLSPGLDYRGIKTPDAVKQYKERPLFIAASSEDSYAAQSAQTLDQLAQGPHRLLILQNQGHGTQMLGKANGLEEALLSWLQEVTSPSS